MVKVNKLFLVSVLDLIRSWSFIGEDTFEQMQYGISFTFQLEVALQL